MSRLIRLRNLATWLRVAPGRRPDGPGPHGHRFLGGALFE